MGGWLDQDCSNSKPFEAFGSCWWKCASASSFSDRGIVFEAVTSGLLIQIGKMVAILSCWPFFSLFWLGLGELMVVLMTTLFLSFVVVQCYALCLNSWIKFLLLGKKLFLAFMHTISNISQVVSVNHSANFCSHILTNFVTVSWWYNILQFALNLSLSRFA